MVILNTYGNIETTVISKKLGLVLSNLPEDWIYGLSDYMTEEILVRDHNIEVWNRMGSCHANIGRYNLEALLKKAKWYDEGDTNEVKNKEIIASKLICIGVDEFDTSLLKLKNSTLDSPTCEMEYSKKFINFCRRVQKSESSKGILKNSIPFVVYSDERGNFKPRILNYLKATISIEDNIEQYKYKCVNSLINIGNIIDDFIETEEDFWKFDYILNSLCHDEEFNAYYVFKVMSLIEMLIINPKNSGKTQGELEEKLQNFMNATKICDSKRYTFISILRRLRNKIAHGDFIYVNELLELYRQEFMEGFSYDEFEYSIESWTYLSICCRLDEILNEILWKFIYDKSALKEIQMS